MCGNGEINAKDTKQCTKCGEVKALDAYYADKRRKYGKQSACKSCAANGNLNYRRSNRERIKTQKTAYYDKNRDRITEIARNYWRNNSEDCKKRRRRWGSENPEAIRSYTRKRRALKRNLPHQPLTREQYDRLYEFRNLVFGEVN